MIISIFMMTRIVLFVRSKCNIFIIKLFFSLFHIYWVSYMVFSKCAYKFISQRKSGCGIKDLIHSLSRFSLQPCICDGKMHLEPPSLSLSLSSCWAFFREHTKSGCYYTCLHASIYRYCYYYFMIIIISTLPKSFSPVQSYGTLSAFAIVCRLFSAAFVSCCNFFIRMLAFHFWCALQVLQLQLILKKM